MTVSAVPYRAYFRVGPTPQEEASKEYVPYVLTPSEKTQAAVAAIHLQKLRIEQNRRDDARALAGVLWVEEQ